MNWTVDLSGTRGYAIVTTSGAFDVADHLRMIEDIVSRPGWRPGTDVLFDHRGLSFDDADLRAMYQASANHQLNDARIGGGKAAILMRSLSDYGRGRQFELLTADRASATSRISLTRPRRSTGCPSRRRDPAREQGLEGPARACKGSKGE